MAVRMPYAPMAIAKPVVMRPRKDSDDRKGGCRAGALGE
jgi:hypothetical protein